MGENMRSKSKHHARITGTFTCSLARQMAETSDAVLSTKLKLLADKVSNLTSTSATKIQHNKLNTKVETVINANNLKRSSI